MQPNMVDYWPALPLADWDDTCETLHRWTQVVGKVRLALTPMANHWWQVPLYLTCRGLTTSPIPYGGLCFQMDFDFIGHRLEIVVSDGRCDVLPLQAGSVAVFYQEVMRRLRRLGIETSITTIPCEVMDAVAFENDNYHASYGAVRVNHFWRILLQSDRVLKAFRARFLGKASPVHFFWGSFDLAVTRFSGRAAPPHPGGVPHFPDWAAREAYSHEVSSCGFWPGNGGFGRAAFYTYAYPEPSGFAQARIRPGSAFYSTELREFILPYDEVRQAAAPDEMLMQFFQSTYEATAELGQWDRAALERPSPPA